MEGHVMSKLLRVAIDGPGGAGKSTIAKKVGEILGLEYIDTGAMYRAFGYKMQENNVSASDLPAVKRLLSETDIDFVDGNIILDGRVLGDEIRTADASMQASKCSAIPEVRAKLGERQKEIGRTKNVVMDGRDIATNVMVDAEVKIFLTASAEERAQRRYLEMKDKGRSDSYEEVLSDINERDHNDTTRKTNPLRPAEDSVIVDTTDMNIEEVVNAILDIVYDKTGRKGFINGDNKAL